MINAYEVTPFFLRCTLTSLSDSIAVVNLHRYSNTIVLIVKTWRHCPEGGWRYSLHTTYCGMRRYLIHDGLKPVQQYNTVVAQNSKTKRDWYIPGIIMRGTWYVLRHDLGGIQGFLEHLGITTHGLFSKRNNRINSLCDSMVAYALRSDFTPSNNRNSSEQTSQAQQWWLLYYYS